MFQKSLNYKRTSTCNVLSATLYASNCIAISCSSTPQTVIKFVAVSDEGFRTPLQLLGEGKANTRKDALDLMQF